MGTLTLQPDATAGKDALLTLATPTTNTPTGASFGIISTGSTSAAIFILSFDLTSLSANDLCDNATLEFTENTPNATPRSIFVYEMLAANQNWTETGATWNTKDGTNAWAGGANGCSVVGTDIGAAPIGTLMYAGNGIAAPTGLVYPIELDRARVKAAFGGLLHLVVLRGGGTSTSASPSFRTSDSTTANARPKLTVNYTSYSVITSGKTVKVVSPTGSDAGTGSLADPWLTPKYGCNHILRGQELWIRGSEFRTSLTTDSNPDFVTLAPASGTTRLKVCSFPGERAVLNGLWAFANADYVDIEDIDFLYPSDAYPTGESSYAQHVKLRGGLGWVMRRCRITGSIAHSALNVDESPSNTGNIPADLFSIEDCLIAHVIRTSYSTNNQDHGIYIAIRCPTQGYIRRSAIFDTHNGNGVKIGHDTNDIGNITVEYCSIYDNDTTATDAQNVHLSHKSLGNTIQYCIMQQPSTGNHNVELVSATGVLGVDYGNNVVRNCIGYSSVGVVNVVSGLTDGGGNQAIDPQFVDRNNGNFTTLNAAVRLYGMFAPRARIAAASRIAAAARVAASGRTTASGRNATG